MDRKKRLWFIILMLLFVGLFIFVIRMQANFANGNYVAEHTTSANTTEISTELRENERNEAEEEDIDEEETNEEYPSSMYVNADQLNVRSGPGAGYYIEGTIFYNDEVQVEELEDEWVKISTDELTGYVSIDYLSEEINE